MDSDSIRTEIFLKIGGKGMSSKSRMIIAVIIFIILLILIITFLIVAGYIKFGSPVNDKT